MKELLKYQEMDLDIKKLEGELSEHSDRKNALKMQQILKDCQSKLTELEKKSSETLKAYNQYKKIYENMVKNLEVIEKNSDTDSSAKMDGLVDAINAITTNLAMLDKEMTNMVNYPSSVQAEYNSIMKNARTAKASMQKYKDSFNNAKVDAEKLLETKRVELAKQGAKVDPKLLARYKQKATEIKKVVVPLLNGKCGGCRIEPSAGKLSILKSKHMIECENCGRIIYIEE